MPSNVPYDGFDMSSILFDNKAVSRFTFLNCVIWGVNLSECKRFLHVLPFGPE